MRQYLTKLILAAALILNITIISVVGREVVDKNKLMKTRSTPTATAEINDYNLCWPASVGIHQTGQIYATFNSEDQIGNGFYSSSRPEFSFETPPESDIEYLFGGAIWVGGIIGEDTLVSVGADGWQFAREMFPPGGPGQANITRFKYPTDLSLRAEFCDTFIEAYQTDYLDHRAHRPMHILIANRAHAWQGYPENKAIIYDMVITNTGTETIENGCIGWYIDADVFHMSLQQDGFIDDLTGSLPEEKIGYIIDNDGDPQGGAFASTSPRRLFAFKYLRTSFDATTTTYNWWRGSSTPIFDFGPRQKEDLRDFQTGGGLGTPEGDRNKYYIMSHPEWDYDQAFTGTITPDDPTWLYPDQNMVTDISDGTDAKFLLSIGPFTLLPDSSIRILFTTFTGEAVHQDPDNFENNLQDEYLPETYLTNLDFSDVLLVAEKADSLADIITNPFNPPTGLEVVHAEADSAVITWDPWVYADVTGYKIYVTEIPDEVLPYPGVVPPWLEPKGPWFYDVASSMRTDTLHGLDPLKNYMVNIQSITATGLGLLSKTAFIERDLRHDPVQITNAPYGYLFIQQGEPLVLEWNAPEGVEVDHYNMYKFSLNEDETYDKAVYLPFYDEGCYRDDDMYNVIDSFLVDGVMYYYYAMEPYAEVEGGTNTFTDYDYHQKDKYVISFVDADGLESKLSEPAFVRIMEPRTRDIAVVFDANPGQKVANSDSLIAIYDNILRGYDYEFCTIQTDISWDGAENTGSFKLVLFDEVYLNSIPFLDNNEDFYKAYLAYGGKIAFGWMLYSKVMTDTLYNTLSKFNLYEQYFGIDEVRGAPFGAEYWPGFYDSSYGFAWAEAVNISLPDLRYQSEKRPIYSTSTRFLWPDSMTAPLVPVYVPTDSTEVLYRFEGYYDNCPLDHLPVCLEHHPFNTETFALGFSLWYMEPIAARQLIDYMMGDDAKTNCVGLTGNVTCNADEEPDISDIIRLIDYLYINHRPIQCYGEANTDGSVDPEPDVSDIFCLINYLYGDHTPPATCPN